MRKQKKLELYFTVMLSLILGWKASLVGSKPREACKQPPLLPSGSSYRPQTANYHQGHPFYKAVLGPTPETTSDLASRERESVDVSAARTPMS